MEGLESRAEKMVFNWKGVGSHGMFLREVVTNSEQEMNEGF